VIVDGERKAMGGNGTTPDASTPARRRWAWTALAALAGLVIALAAVVARSRGTLLALVLAAALYLVLAAAASWWAFTTRKTWKRWLNLAVIAFLVVALVVDVVAFSLWHAGGVLAIVVAALVYALAARQVLSGDMPAASAGTVPGDVIPPARPWLPWARSAAPSSASTSGWWATGCS